MDSKTPVTLLHELLTKQCATPDYLLVHNGVGTHDPLFVFQVSALGKTAVGNGKSKKEAKHEAARQLLYMINDVERKIDGVMQSPYADMLKENAVGALQDFCQNYKINAPTYEQFRDEGLPHAKLFGVKCNVSTLTTKAEARTKKQAKQNAAHAMISKLKECLHDEIICEFSQKETIDEEMDSKHDIAKDRVNAIFDSEDAVLPQSRPIGTTLDRYDELFKEDVFQVSEAFNKIREMELSDFEQMDDPVALFNEFAEQLNFKFKLKFLQVKSGIQDILICLTIHELNDATFFGCGVDEASANRAAFVSALKWFAVMGR